MSQPGGPQQILAILLGASEWPRWPDLDNPAFAHSHAAVRDYLTTALGLGEDQILDLFGSPRQPGELAQDIRAFLGGPAAAGGTDVILHYVGHGGRVQPGDRYVVMPACGDRALPGPTGLTPEDLFAATRDANRTIRLHVVLDACFGAAVADTFSLPVNSAGVAVLAAASSADTASAPDDRHATVFTQALLAVLRRGEPEGGRRLSLRQVNELVRTEIGARGHDGALPEIHSPQQRRGDVAAVPLFPNSAYGYARPEAAAEKRSWCVVISESDAEGGRFADAVDVFIDSYRADIENETGWSLEPAPQVVRAGEVFGSPRALQEAVAATCAADLAFFDLTTLEPAPLLLLGVRSVIRRGVTICSTARSVDRRVGETPPFLPRDINITGHGPDVGQPEDVFGERVRTGIQQLAAEPHRYADLPIFDLVRQPPPDAEQRTIRPYHESALVLCSFSPAYTATNWRLGISRFLPSAIRRQADEDGLYVQPGAPRVERTLDMGSPQVVSASLLQAVRYNALCVCDLSEWRPNVLFELGMRLAAQRLHPVCILDPRRVPDDGSARDRLDRMAGQTRDLGLLLGVLEYEPGRREDYREMVRRHIRARDALDQPFSQTWSGGRLPAGSGGDLPAGGVYQVAWQYAESAHEPSLAVLDLLRETHSAQETRTRGSTPFIFPPRHAYTELAVRSSTERLAAAWLYLKHRRGWGDPADRDQALELGQKLVQRLVNFPAQEDQELSREVQRDLARIREMMAADEP